MSLVGFDFGSILDFYSFNEYFLNIYMDPIGEKLFFHVNMSSFPKNLNPKWQTK